jgi:hypothetical protein
VHHLHGFRHGASPFHPTSLGLRLEPLSALAAPLSAGGSGSGSGGMFGTGYMRGGGAVTAVGD